MKPQPHPRQVEVSPAQRKTQSVITHRFFRLADGMSWVDACRVEPTYMRSLIWQTKLNEWIAVVTVQ